MTVRHSADVSAFSEFVTARSAALFRTAYLILGDHQLAQDLVQEALVKTYVAWPRIREPRKAEAYTRRTIVTTAISWRRRRSFHERPTDALPERQEPDQVEVLDCPRRTHVVPSSGPCRRECVPRSCCATTRTSPRPGPPS